MFSFLRLLKVYGSESLSLSSTTVQIQAGQHIAKCIVLGDTLTTRFSVDEIETVLAHEFGHHVHKDLTTGIIVQSVLTLFGFWLTNM